MRTWTPQRYETQGAVQGKVWVTDGENLALFKPDSELCESKIEKEVFDIAHKLGISCAKTELGEMFGQRGILSHNFKIDNAIIYCPADSLYLKSGDVTFRSKDTEQNALPSNSRSLFALNLPVNRKAADISPPLHRLVGLFYLH